jgi:hypothetical protein
MRKGDWVVCITDEFFNYTKGKSYQLLRDVSIPDGAVLEIANDKGYVEKVMAYGVRDNYKFSEKGFGAVTERVYYFMLAFNYSTIEDVRERKLKQLGI